MFGDFVGILCELDKKVRYPDCSVRPFVIAWFIYETPHNSMRRSTITLAAPIQEGFIPFRGYRTWYRIVGNPVRSPSAPVPLLLLHGGPGLPHESLESLSALALTGRPIICYDQLGCGNSVCPPDAAVWSVDPFREEVATVCHALGLDQVHLLGHSWGGMLALEYALRQPAGLLSLVLHSTFASCPIAWPERERVRAEWSPDIAQTLQLHEANNTFDHPDYQTARQMFDQRHTCRVAPWPDSLQTAIAKANWHLNAMMWAPSPSHPHGLLRQWDVCERLGELRLPTLITSGRYDAWVPGQDELLQHGIGGSRWVRFEESSHYAHVEEAERYQATVAAFLNEVEAKPPGH